MRCYLLLNFFGEDFVAIVDFTVTSPYRSATFYDPPEGPEWETESIYLAQDFAGYLGAAFEATGKLFDHLDEALADGVAEYIRDNYEPEVPYD